MTAALADLTRVRIAAIDNAKVLLVLLVVVGHALTPSTGQSVALADTLFLWIFCSICLPSPS